MAHHTNGSETPGELTRRTFMAQAVIFGSGVVGLGLMIPLATSLAPAAEPPRDHWMPLPEKAMRALHAATEKTPVVVRFNVRAVNGYFGLEDDAQYAFGVRATEEQMRQARPELWDRELVPFPVATLGFVLFSPICPHLGCPVRWMPSEGKFLCPCHGSQYNEFGAHQAGPALRGLDPLPVRSYRGKVQVTWIDYKSNTPQMIVQYVG